MTRSVLALGLLAAWLAADTPRLAAQAGLPSPAASRVRLPSEESARLLARPVNFPGLAPRATLLDALAALEKTAGLDFAVDDWAFSQDECRQPLAALPVPPRRDAPLAEVLAGVLARVPVAGGATFYLDGTTVRVTSRRQVVADARFVVYRIGHSVYRHARSHLVQDVRRRGPAVLRNYAVEATNALGAIAAWNRFASATAQAALAEAGGPRP